MHANEAGCQWPTEVLEDVFSELRTVELNRYPDTSARNLRELIARRLGCERERVVVGNGSAEIVGLFYSMLCSARSPVLVVPVPAFAMFANSGHAYGYEVRTVPLTPALQLDLAAMRAALRGATLCVIARPNNPTGSLYPRESIDALVAEFPETLFIIDEAYGPYAPGSSLFDVQAPPNQVHLGSLSKNGLAALRIGYCAADPGLVLELDRIRMPYNVPQTSIVLAEALLTRHSDTLDRVASETRERREQMRSILAALPGACVHPSHANMVLVSFATRDEAVDVQRALLERDVQVRHVSDEPGFAALGLHGCLRVSVGDPEELTILESAVDEIAEQVRDTAVSTHMSAAGATR